jgi:hypothetical protein
MKREYRRDVVRVIELGSKGFSHRVIASTVGLDEDLVRLILEKAGEVSGAGEGRL